jgi:hypothetical protein
MESPKTGVLLLALVAVTTAAGGFLGWTRRPPTVAKTATLAAPIDRGEPISLQPASETLVDAPCADCPGDPLADSAPSALPPVTLRVPAE